MISFSRMLVYLACCSILFLCSSCKRDGVTPIDGTIDNTDPNFPSSFEKQPWDIVPLTYASNHVFSPDGKLLAVSYFGLVKIVDVISNTVIYEFGDSRLDNSFRPDAFAKFSKDGSKLLVNVVYPVDKNFHQDQDSVLLVDPNNGIILQTFPRMETPVLSSNGLYVAGICKEDNNNFLDVYSTQSGQRIRRIEELYFNSEYIGFYGLLSCFCDNDKDIVFSHVKDGFYIIDWQNEIVKTSKPTSDWAYQATSSSDGRRVLYNAGNKCQIFDTKTLEIFTVNVDCYNPFVRAISSDGMFVVFAPYRNGSREKPTIFRVQDGKQMLTLQCDDIIDDYTGFAFSKDNKMVTGSSVKFANGGEYEPGHYMWSLK